MEPNSQYVEAPFQVGYMFFGPDAKKQARKTGIDITKRKPAKHPIYNKRSRYHRVYWDNASRLSLNDILHGLNKMHTGSKHERAIIDEAKFHVKAASDALLARTNLLGGNKMLLD